MSFSSLAPAGLIGRIVALGGEGWSWAEIAAGLGVTAAQLEVVAGADAGVAEALALAEGAARAWWLALPREAMALRAPFNHAAWRAAVIQRFGAAALDGGAEAAGDGNGDARAAGAAATPVVRFEIPDNGRRRGPDGWAPCDGGERARQWDLKQADDEIRELKGEIRQLGEHLEEALARREEILTDEYEERHDGDEPYDDA